jgi:hypothetical protein
MPGRALQKTEREFTERAIMSLVMETAEIKEMAARIVVVVAALALAHGISTEV